MKNGEGYKDPTAAAAIAAIRPEEKRQQVMIRNLKECIRYIASLNGLKVTRMEFTDKQGRIYK